MGQSASQAAAFYRDVAASRELYTLRDAEGCPAPLKSTGQRAQPFWSTKSRVSKLQKSCPAYATFELLIVSWEDFVTSWVPSFEENDLLVGLNWSGANATGYDLNPKDVVSNVEGRLQN